MWPDFLPDVLSSLRIPNYLTYASELLAASIGSLHTHLCAHHSGDGGAAAFRTVWMETVISPLLSSIASASLPSSPPSHAESILQAALPAVLTAHPEGLGWLLQLTAARMQGAQPSAAEPARPVAGPTAPPSGQPSQPTQQPPHGLPQC